MNVRACAVDAVVWSWDHKLLVLRRNHEPFEGKLVLPGGFVDSDETVEHAICREVEEETGFLVHIERFIGFYDDPNRDPRQNISFAYECYPDAHVDQIPNYQGHRDDEGDVLWLSTLELTKALTEDGFGFDHAKIILDASLHIDCY